MAKPVSYEREVLAVIRQRHMASKKTILAELPAELERTLTSFKLDDLSKVVDRDLSSLEKSKRIMLSPKVPGCAELMYYIRRPASKRARKKRFVVPKTNRDRPGAHAAAS